jgi:hypothetical protein
LPVNVVGKNPIPVQSAANRSFYEHGVSRAFVPAVLRKYSEYHYSKRMMQSQMEIKKAAGLNLPPSFPVPPQAD